MPYPGTMQLRPVSYNDFSMLYVAYYMKSTDVFYYFSHVDVTVCDESQSYIHSFCTV